MVNDNTSILEFKDTDLGYNGKAIMHNLNFSVSAGEIVCLLGPNGVGKTTLFKTMLGFIPPIAGKIIINNTDISEISPRDFARLIAYVPQTHATPFPYKAKEVVLFGRAVHLGIFAAPGKRDHKIAEECLELLEVKHLAERPFTELSGGEKQMVIFARALAQEAQFIILDEPTSNLDYGNQVRIIRKINELKKQSAGILMATHSPDHAFMVGSKVIMMEKGNIYKSGLPETVITSDNLKKIYGIDVSVIGTKEYNTVCVPIIN